MPKMVVNASGLKDSEDKILKEMAIRIEATANQMLADHGTIDTGELSGSSMINKTGTGYRITWSAPQAEWIEYGTDPHRPPFQPLYMWARRKLGLPDKEARKRAYAMVNKIERVGTESKPFIIPAIYKVLDELKR